MNPFYLSALPVANALASLLVNTSSGFVQGGIDSITPSVAQFLGVPYAEQPVGARRWLPAILKSREDKNVIDATRFGPACPQYRSDTPTTWVNDAPEFQIEPRDYQGEDCLSVNIWAPLKQGEVRVTSAERLPVIAWIHGGSFQTGGASTPYQIPSRWIERSGKHIVVGIK